MKTLKENFKMLLVSDCLNPMEKKLLKKMFSEFLRKRDIINRPTIENHSEDYNSSKWVQNNIG